MKQLKFDYVLDEQQKQHKENLTRFLLEQPIIQEWMRTHQADGRYIYEHCGMFQEYFNVMEKCYKCQGLSLCSHPMKGMRRELMVNENLLLPIYVSCPYQKQESQLTAHKSNYLTYDFPESFLRIDLKDIEQNKRNVFHNKAIEKIKEMVNLNQEKGLYVFGEPEVEKNYLLAGMCNELAKKGKTICFINVPKLIENLKQIYNDDNLIKSYLHHIIHCDVLVLDEIGSEIFTPWSRDEIIFPILNQRMEQQKLTCFTSIYSSEDLCSKYAFANDRYYERVPALRILERINILSDELFIKKKPKQKKEEILIF